MCEVWLGVGATAMAGLLGIERLMGVSRGTDRLRRAAMRVFGWNLLGAGGISAAIILLEHMALSEASYLPILGVVGGIYMVGLNTAELAFFAHRDRLWDACKRGHWPAFIPALVFVTGVAIGLFAIAAHTSWSALLVAGIMLAVAAEQYLAWHIYEALRMERGPGEAAV